MASDEKSNYISQKIEEEGEIFIKNVQSSTSLKPPCQELVQSSSIKISRLNFTIKGILVSVLSISVLFFVKLWSSYINVIKIEPESTSPEPMFQIMNSKGKIITFNYTKPYLYRPNYLPEQIQPQIHYQSLPSLKEFIRIILTQFEFSYRLHGNWFPNEKVFYQAEYFKLNQKFDLDSNVSEKHICLLTEMKNIGKHLQIFIRSIDQQNYSNYRVYLLQDALVADNQTAALLELVKNYPHLNNRLQVIRSKQKIGILGLQDYVIRTYSSPGDIIMEIDMEGSFIGKQVLNTINRMYNLNKNAWFYYTNYVRFEGNNGKHSQISNSVYPGVNPKINQVIQRQGWYRTSQVWLMGGLRSYLRDLYVKIPNTHLLQRGIGKYHVQASEMFISFAISELAGADHTVFYSGYPYLIHNNPQLHPHHDDDEQCIKSSQRKCQNSAKIQTPFRPLKSLQQNVAIIKNYTIPQNIMRAFIQSEWQQKICQSKQKNQDKIFHRV